MFIALNISKTIDLLDKLGLPISMSKSVLIPSKKIVFWNLCCALLTEEMCAVH
jgi:hypothetical protein